MALGLMKSILNVVLSLVVVASSISHAAPLTRAQYLATFSGPNKRLDEKLYDVSYVWPYVQLIPPEEHPGFEICWGYVPFVYQTSNGEYDHVYVSTRTQNVFLLVVRQNQSASIFGHHLLNLNEEYGMSAPKQITRQCDSRPNKPLQPIAPKDGAPVER
jgi:hypothetical protein